MHDKQNVFSDAQAVTSSAVSDGQVDLGGKNRGQGTPLHVICQVETTFSGGTSIQVSLKHASTAAGVSAGEKLWEGPAIAVASLVAGYVFNVPPLPHKSERFVGLYYTVVGTMSLGKVDAFLALNRPNVDNQLAIDTNV